MFDLAYIKERLLAKRAEIHRQMALFAQDHAPTEDPSLDEGGQDWAETSLDFQTSQQDPLIKGNEQHLLTEVQHALERLEQGTYGMCIVCGQPIPEKRLEALPWAARCVKLEALSAFVSTLFIAFLMLIPQQSFLVDGIEVLGVGLLTWILMIYLHLDTFRKAPASYRNALIVHQFMTYHLAALSFVGASVTFLIWGAPGFYVMVAATLLSYLAAFVDTWLLAVEINR